MHTSLERAVFFGSLLLAFSCSLLAREEKNVAAPSVAHARSYAYHQEQPEEKVTVAAGPYDTADKTYSWQADLAKNGFMPLLLVISNDGDSPITVGDLKIQMITAGKAKLEAVTTDDVLRRIARQRKRPQSGSASPLPFPLPRKKPNPRQAEQEIEAAQFKALAVEPHATRSGFLFFDVAGITDALSGATLYVSGLQDSNGRELLYFEIPLGNTPARSSAERNP